jgi:hypothetical protein
MKLALRTIVALGLLVDAYIHVDLASQYDPVTSGSISQGGLFRVEAVAAVLAAVLVVALRRRASDLLAVSVAIGGVFAVLLYRYVEVGPIGPLPSIYEPVWYAEKTLSLVAEALAAAAALTVLALGLRRVKRVAEVTPQRLATALQTHPPAHRPSAG